MVSMLASCSDEPRQVRSRPGILRALGANEPPLLVEVDGAIWERQEIFKHDSWAATAVYRSRCGRRIVCKFNRQMPIAVVPMRWLGRWLARREKNFLKTLAGVPGIPRVFDAVRVGGQLQLHAVAHDFIAGQPLSVSTQVSREFFERMERLLAELHRRGIAYVDLHKQENVLVGDDGHPYLIDFQVSVQLPATAVGQKLFQALRDADLYHLDKHRWLHGVQNGSRQAVERPLWLRMHRSVAVPLRGLRRRLLVAIGVRRGNGCATTEVAPEVGLRSKPAA